LVPERTTLTATAGTNRLQHSTGTDRQCTSGQSREESVDVSSVTDSKGACPFAGDLGDLAAALADPVMLMDVSGDLRWGNHAAERLFGMTLAEGLGRNMLEFLHPDDAEIAVVAVAAMRDKEIGTLLELRIRGAEGWRLVEVRGTVFGGDILLSVRDITDRRRWEVTKDAAAEFRALMQNAASITLVLERSGEIRSSSSVVTRLLGQNQEQLEGSHLECIVDVLDRAELTTALDAVVEPGAQPVTVDLRLLRRPEARGGRGVVPFAMTFTNLLDDPTVGGVVATGHDISDRVLAEEELRESNSLLATTLEATTEGILVVDQAGRITSFNQRFAEMWSIPDAVLEALDEAEAVAWAVDHLVDPESFLAKVQELYAQPEAISHDVLHFRTGRVFERNSRPRRLFGEVVGRVWSFRDITEHEELKHQLAHQALHDSLTGLPNKSLFCDHVDHAVARLARSQNRVAVLFIDLDDFKNVNDTLGHWAGDALLVQLAERLQHQLRRGDTAARLGGDEFAVLLDGLSDDEVPVEVARRIIEALQAPIDIATRRLTLSASIGIAFGSSQSDTDELLRNADIAMYAAKAQGKNCSRVFTPDMHASALDRLESVSAPTRTIA
jgi:diguanylate cyclase (GGDEF)-like protein/PAS domain S-box-containing protein